METISEWEREAELFDGDNAMFWAGRMSIAAAMVVRSGALGLSDAINLLDQCRQRYDAIVFGLAIDGRPKPHQ